MSVVFSLVPKNKARIFLNAALRRCTSWTFPKIELYDGGGGENPTKNDSRWREMNFEKRREKIDSKVVYHQLLLRTWANHWFLARRTLFGYDDDDDRWLRSDSVNEKNKIIVKMAYIRRQCRHAVYLHLSKRNWVVIQSIVRSPVDECAMNMNFTLRTDAGWWIESTHMLTRLYDVNVERWHCACTLDTPLRFRLKIANNKNYLSKSEWKTTTKICRFDSCVASNLD